VVTNQSIVIKACLVDQQIFLEKRQRTVKVCAPFFKNRVELFPVGALDLKVLHTG
jgi:hypothetical protein